jgi:hypothetical protein
LALLYSLRTRLPFFKARFPSLTIILLTLTAALVTLIVPFTHLGQRLFHFIPPSPIQLGLIIGVTLAYFITTETVKLLYYHTFTGPHRFLAKNQH